MSKQKMLLYALIVCIIAAGMWCYHNSRPDPEAISMYITHTDSTTPVSPRIQHYIHRGAGSYLDSRPIDTPTMECSDGEIITLAFNQRFPSSITIDKRPIENLDVAIGALILTKEATPIEFEVRNENELIFSLEEIGSDYQLIVITAKWTVIGRDIMAKYIVLCHVD